MFKINPMNFLDKINSGISKSKIEVANQLAQRSNRYSEILSIIIIYCKDVEFITNKDIKEKSRKFRWLCSVTDIHLTSMMLMDQIDGNDVPMNSEMIKEDNKNKAKQITESIALYLIAESPKPDLRSS